jgi:hypothetical protein
MQKLVPWNDVVADVEDGLWSMLSMLSITAEVKISLSF